MTKINVKHMFGIATAVLGASVMVLTLILSIPVSQEETAVAVKNEMNQVFVQEVEETPFLNKCMATNVQEYVFIKETPDDVGNVLGKMYIGASGDVLEKNGTWTKLSSGSVTGYVRNIYLVYDKDAENLANEVCKWTVKVNTDALNVRKEPGTDSLALGLAYRDEVYDLVSKNDGWVEVLYEEEAGYLAEEYVILHQDIKTAISLEEEAAAIAAEEARLAAIAAEEARLAAEREAKIRASIEGSRFVETIQTSPYTVSESDAYLLACVVDCEAGWESYEGKLAVANIVLNRLRNGYYGNTIESVVYARNQFSVVGTILNNRMINGPRQESIDATKAALAGENNVPEYSGFCSLRVANYDSYSAYTIIGNHVFYRR